MPSALHVGLSLSAAEDLREAALPLFADGEVDAIEWSLDLGFGGVPRWLDALLGHYGAAGRLVAHGVELSTFTVGQEARRRAWMDRAMAELGRHPYVHLTEHVGIMTAGRTIGGTPLPHPYSRSAVAVGRARLRELRERSGLPVGLENLAFALGPADLDAQPDFLEALLDDDGFVLLDLHNLLCQAESFGRDPIELLLRQPLHRVRELHLAGGNLFHARAGGPPLRRDDHERVMPESIFALLEVAIARCPSLGWIVVEHADESLQDAAELEAFRAAYRRVRTLAAARGEVPPFVPPAFRPPPDDGSDDASLDRAQVAFFDALTTSESPAALREALATPALAPWRPWLDGFDPRAVELGLELVARWGERSVEPASGKSVAVVLEAPGVIRLREPSMPVPGPGEVVLRVEACGVCGTDVHLARGELPAPLPLLLGHETVGVIETCGEGVTLPLGTRVAVPWAQASCGGCAPCRGGHPRHCEALRTWIALGGGLALHTRAVAAGCVPVPEGLSAIEAAPLACGGHTVWSAIERANVTRGARVAVVGLGGLGHLAVQRAARLGAEVVVVTRSPSKVRDAAALGAHAFLVGAAADLERAGGADVVLHCGASATDVGSWARALRPEGRLVVVGLSSSALSVPAGVLHERGATVTGAMSGETSELAAAMEAAARGEWRAQVEVYPLGQVARAFYRLGGGRVRYRAVVAMG